MGKGKKRKKKKQNCVKKQGQLQKQQPQAEVLETEQAESEKAKQEEKQSEKTGQTEKEPKKGEETKAEPEKGGEIISEPEDIEPAEKKAFPSKKFWMILGGSVFAVVGAVYVTGMIYLHHKFLPNTFVNGIDMSFHTVEEAEKRISDWVENYQMELEERGGDRETITAEQLGYRYVSKGEVESFQKDQKTYLWPVSIWKSSEYQFESSTEFDEKKLNEVIRGLKCCDRKQETAPTDAHIKFNGTTYEIVKETQGKKIKKKRLKSVLAAAAAASENVVSLEEKKCYAAPAIKEDDPLLNKTVRNMNRFAKSRIVYKFGAEQDILDGSIISKWLSCDEKGNVTLDEEKIGLYVDYLAERYDTYGKGRKFTTHDGSEIIVEGGRYGWLIDREAETEELKEWIYNGSRRTRVPVYAQTAVSRENSDLGESYVEVDLTNQHVWMYMEGNEIVSTEMVSGTYTDPSRRTPPGTYTIYYKKSPAVLKGADYENNVSYWMPFNGGIGLHDANWRGSFGGSIYQYSGSHGCINLPTGAAAEIYENIYSGMPVICYY